MNRSKICTGSGLLQSPAAHPSYQPTDPPLINRRIARHAVNLFDQEGQLVLDYDALLDVWVWHRQPRFLGPRVELGSQSATGATSSNQEGGAASRGTGVNP